MANRAMFFLPLLIIVAAAEVYPDTVIIIFNYASEEIRLELKLTNQYLANRHLPIWSAFKDTEPAIIPYAMESVGSFRMYQDVAKSAAVVFFYATQTLSGVVDARFYISNLPYRMTGSNYVHTADGPYVHHRIGLHDHIAPNVPLAPPDFQVAPQAGPSRSNPQVAPNGGGDILFPEILVFVSHNLLQHINWEPHEVATIVKYYLIYLNSIDMIYAKLAANGIVIHLNIAGIVLEAEKDVFPYVADPSAPLTKILPENTLQSFYKYMKKYNRQFPENSYDFFFISTDYSMDYGAVELAGVALPYDVYNNKKTKNAVPKLPGVIIQKKPLDRDIFTAAHELAHVMNILHDEATRANCNNNVQCLGIMTPINSYCRRCITWSPYSITQFQNYIGHPDHCILLNLPRSLQPYGSVITTLSPIQQCRCYGYQYHTFNGGDETKISAHRCDRKLECSNVRNPLGPVNSAIPLPVDGTPCGLNKVCWMKQCENIRIRRYG